jgi:hypothetical protein
MLRRSILTAIITMAVSIPCLTLTGKAACSIGNHDFEIQNNTLGTDIDIVLASEGLIFTGPYKTYEQSWLSQGFSVAPNGAKDGFYAPGQGTPEFPCGLLTLTISGTGKQTRTLHLNFLDGNWATNPNKIRLTVEDGPNTTFALSFTVCIGSTSYGPYAIGPTNDNFSYGGIMNYVTQVQYVRNRDGFNFPSAGSPHYVPGNTVTNAVLDVNCMVHGDITVPQGSTLRVEGYYFGSAYIASTSLEYDANVGMTVLGTLQTAGNVNMWTANSTIKWTGLTCDNAVNLDLATLLIFDAQTGVTLQDCSGIQTSCLAVGNSVQDGFLIENTAGTMNLTASGPNGWRGMSISGAFCDLTMNTVDISGNAWDGILHRDGGLCKIRHGSIQGNARNGVCVTQETFMWLDDLRIGRNGTAAGGNPPYAGVFAYGNAAGDHWLSIQNCKVWDNPAGLRVQDGRILGYHRNGTTALYPLPQGLPWTPEERDGHNCIFLNDYNLYGNTGDYHLGSYTTDQGGSAVCLGAINTIFKPRTPNLEWQGYFVNVQPHADFYENYWNNQYTFSVVNSNFAMVPELTSDLNNCLGETSDTLEWKQTHSAPSSTIVGGHFQSTADFQSMRDFEGMTTIDALASTILRMTPSKARRALSLAVILLRPEMVADLCNAIAGETDDITLESRVRQLEGEAVIRMSGHTAEQAISAITKTAPTLFALEAPHPNPCTPGTTIGFSLAAPAAARLSVYDALGREVEVLADETLGTGHHTRTFDAGGLPNGMYYFRLTVGGAALTQKVLVTK